MTVWRRNAEPDPGPATIAQIDQSSELAGKRPGPRAILTGQDAGLSQSLADLRDGYRNAAKIQSDQDQQAAIQRTNVAAQIKENVPTPGVNFVGHGSEQYETGDSSQVPSSDPMWQMPVEHLQTNLQLLEETTRAIDKVSQTRSPKDFQHAAELGQRLQQSVDRDIPRSPEITQPPTEPASSPQARQETFPDGQVVHVNQNPDGTLHVEYATGKRFDGDPLTVAQNIGQAHVNTKKWARQQRAQTPQPQQEQQAIFPHREFNTTRTVHR